MTLPPLPPGALYRGHVMHQRLRPLRHRLRYRVFSLLLDLDELPALAARLRFFSLDRFNLFSLRPADYGAGATDIAGLRAHVDGQLRAARLPPAARVRLLTMPRILGYAFNPLSVYFCEAADGRPMAILYEVNNTFGERHSYLIEVDDVGSDGLVRQRCDKRMYVSPFLGLDMHYRFSIRPPAVDAPLVVGVDAHDAQGPLLVARLDARAHALTDGALLSAFFTHPLLTLKVVGAIHWEALRLWLKGVRLTPRPRAPAETVTVTVTTKARIP